VGCVSLCDNTYYYLRHDVKDRTPLDDACVEWVYAEHFIEHLDPKVAIAWLAEVRRMLKPGGFLRLSTPDLAKYMKAYCDPADRFFELHRDRLRTVGMPQPANRMAWMINQIFYFWGHRWLYDLDELTYAAAAAGFPSHCVAQVGFREGRLREVAEFDLAVRDDESLYVEITKPGV
jgi:predicted SAM-dependent methyltransferase